MTNAVFWSLSGLAAFFALALIYHHAVFPIILRWQSNRKPMKPEAKPVMPVENLPPMTVFMPAYNEADNIAEKIRNLAAIDYPERLLRVIIVCDGCTDDTAALARETLASSEFAGRIFEIIEEKENRGKIAVLNRYLPTIPNGIIALSDVSAEIEPDAFRRAAFHFEDRSIGVVAATYTFRQNGSSGEAAYWRYQIANKIGEAAFGAPLGAHGALYFVRAGDFRPLEPDTINDDFIIPMRIVVDGKKAIYDPAIVATEREIAGADLDFRRRLRISAGNVQQILLVPALFSPRLGWVAFAFLSGKALRAFAPFMIVAFLAISIALGAVSGPWLAIAAFQILGILAVTVRHFLLPSGRSRLLDVAHYIAVGHLAGLIGGSRYLIGNKAAGWRQTRQSKEKDMIVKTSFQPTSVLAAKRTLDVIGASIGLAISVAFVPLICLAIKLDSKGPIVFRQTRIGRAWPNYTELFTMYKFRTMRVDAEKTTGPVWASKNDPRITRVGRFLRKTRLDEIPQLINVLKGEMSLVGPRPERPGICDKLETQIPYFAERTYGVRPGITGLAQVFQGYDETIEDARSKVSYDHAYALASASWKSWLKLDVEILARTVGVVVLGRGQ